MSRNLEFQGRVGFQLSEVIPMPDHSEKTSDICGYEQSN